MQPDPDLCNVFLAQDTRQSPIDLVSILQITILPAGGRKKHISLPCPCISLRNGVMDFLHDHSMIRLQPPNSGLGQSIHRLTLARRRWRQSPDLKMSTSYRALRSRRFSGASTASNAISRSVTPIARHTK
jgi:hypothetical protein